MSPPASRLAAFRDFYARLVVANSGATTNAERLMAAFQSVPREDFLGGGPWSVFTPAGYLQTPADDPAILYQDIVVSLAGPAGPINNGQPSLHAACLAALDPAPGERGIHVGAGTGYYTAILAELVGSNGRVDAYEIEPGLADRARRNLALYPEVDVECRSGATGPLPEAGFVYVNAGATHPAEAWLDALKPGGRLLFPLTPAEGMGGMLLLRKVNQDAFAARFVCPAMFIPCAGARDEALAGALTAAFRAGGVWAAASLRRRSSPDESCCLAGGAWWLSKSGV